MYKLELEIMNKTRNSNGALFICLVLFKNETSEDQTERILNAKYTLAI